MLEPSSLPELEETFCAGADIQALKSRSSLGGEELSLMEDLRDGFNPIISRMRNMDKPIIAMVNGVAAGAGMGLAFASDLRIMSENARFAEAFAKIGLVPDSGVTFFMPRLLGITKAMELAFTGESMDAAESLKLGIVNKVVPPDRLEAETRELAEKLARGPKGMGLSKRAINKACTWTWMESWITKRTCRKLQGRRTITGKALGHLPRKEPPNFQGK